MTIRASLLTLLMAACNGSLTGLPDGGVDAGACNAETCDGCCLGTACQHGDAGGACGFGGAACFNCENSADAGGSLCMEQTCSSPWTLRLIYDMHSHGDCARSVASCGALATLSETHARQVGNAYLAYSICRVTEDAGARHYEMDCRGGCANSQCPCETPTGASTSTCVWTPP